MSQKSKLGVVELLGKIDIHLMRVVETSGFLPERILLLQAVVADFHRRTGLIDALSVQEERRQHLAESEFAGLKRCFLPGLHRVKEKQRLLFAEVLIGKADEIRLDLMTVLFVNAVNLLVAGIGDLLGILGQLDLGLEGAVLVLYGCKLVDAAEARIVLGGNQVRADSEGIDAGTLLIKRIDEMLIQIVGAADLCLRIAGSVQHLAGFLGQIRKIAGIQADADVIQRKALFLHIIKGSDGVRNAASKGVIGVYEKRAGGRIKLCIGLEGFELTVKAHDPAVGMCAENRNVKKLTAQDIGGSCAAGNYGSSCTIRSGIRSLCAAKTELHDGSALCGVADPGGFGCNQTLMIDDAQNGGFHKLRLHDGSDNLYNRLSRENQRTLRNAVDITVKMKICKIIQKIRIENTGTAQIFNVLRREVQILDVTDQLFYAAHDGISSAKGIVSEKCIKDHGLVLIPMLEIALHHGELIEIGKQCQILSVHDYPFSCLAVRKQMSVRI